MQDLHTLMEWVKQFSQEREWDQFHNPKDLSIGMVTEAAELLDIFRFKTSEDMQLLMVNEKGREHIGEELADVMYFLLRFADMYKFDLADELKQKLQKNALKYPVDTSKGSNKKYTEG
ncbi:nucleotide pyrophosphohydrolase [Paenibacillus psychroresistens]|uniref:Nucleotide pyrophosphohydrolase n=1 Tax=Paenibacillus psychroresistens TaxID=1778678 RepID=A0A6B8RFJ0_9BACL|nr:nucleotide pyrophosphohydrolase [Paenibacillus psychroresistens]QGQ94188.1 nucleotide pyrophosphohydrolase [Paenibacillus psychroresistens]